MDMKKLKFLYITDRFGNTERLPITKVTDKSFMVGSTRVPIKELQEKGEWYHAKHGRWTVGAMYYLPTKELEAKFKMQCKFSYVKQFLNKFGPKELYENHKDIFELILTKINKG
jgi:hypothetical protein